MKKALLVVLAVLLVSSLSVAQLSAGKIGISTDIPGSSIGAAYALSENMRLDAGLSFSSTSTTGGTSTTAFGLGGSVKMYSPAMENVSYFYGAGLNFGSVGSPAVTTIGINVLGGAEYWFSSRFAWGGYVSLGFANSGPSGAKTTVIGTQGVSTTLTWWIN
ncbi:MAG: hypothetical protein ACYC09_07010 [Bacteroidota bacterium]